VVVCCVMLVYRHCDVPLRYDSLLTTSRALHPPPPKQPVNQFNNDHLPRRASPRHCDVDSIYTAGSVALVAIDAIAARWDGGEQRLITESQDPV
jgi:hypothetical protein